MFQNKTDILLFLLYIGILIFAEKIVIAGTCQISTVKLWLCLMFVTCFISNIRRSKSSNNLSIQKTLSNNFLKYLAEWNATKMKYHGKDEMKCIVYFLSKIMSIYLFLFSGSIGSKLIYHGKVLLRNLIFYIVYVSGSEMSDIDRRRYGCGGWESRS